VLRRRRKGFAAHRALGWCWVAGMAFVATSSFAIRDLRDGRLGFLHVLSVVTLVSLVLGIRAARRHDQRGHRAAMRGSYRGLVGAFVAAVAVPGRTIPTFVVSDPLGAAAAAVAVVATTALLVLLGHAAGRRGIPRASGASLREVLAIRRHEQVPGSRR
jgi:uncharacterized membrane protein